MKYAIQIKDNGQVIDYCNSVEEASYFLSQGNIELIEIANKSVVKVHYCEMGGPNGYGHSEESFATYGSIRRCMCNLIKWMQETVRLFGPDVRDIYDFFRYCSLEVNGKDKSQWLYNQIDKRHAPILYV